MIVHISNVHVFKDTRIQRHLSSSSKCIFIGIGESDSPKFKPVFRNRTFTNRLLFIFLFLAYIPKSASKVIIHDPELIFSAWLIKVLRGANVAVYFDAHEDVLKDILQKIWLKKWMRKVFSIFFNVIFIIFLPRIDGIMTVNQPLKFVYAKFNKNIYVLPNYPKKSELGEFRVRTLKKPLRELKICYVGSISQNRGIKQILEIAVVVSNPIILIGSFTDEKLFNWACSQPGWSNITFKGAVPYEHIREQIEHCEAGLLLLENIDTFRDSTPVKIFDYGKLNQIILWTGSDDCHYKKYFDEGIAGIRIGSDLKSIQIDYDEIRDFSIQNDLSNYTWETASVGFY